MLYMLDTDMCSYIIREKPQQVLDLYRNIMDTKDNRVYVSVVTCAELLHGALIKPSMTETVRAFLSVSTTRDWTFEAAVHYAEIAVSMKKSGRTIGTHDMQISGHARSIGATIVTDNDRHFEHVPGLIVENWAK